MNISGLSSALPASPTTRTPAPTNPPEPPPCADPHETSSVQAAPQASAAPAAPPLRDPQQAVRFCDRFNAGENLKPSDLQDKLQLMVSGPLKLARCMPALMMSDLLGPYASLGSLSDRPAPVVWIDGDAHLGNFGVIRGSDGHAAWGLNDFDMTCQGSPAMDLDRLAFSLVSTMRELGVSPEQSPAVVDTLGRAYLKEMGALAQGQDSGLANLSQAQTSAPIQKLVGKCDAIKRKDWIQKYAAQDAHGDWGFVYSKDVDPVDLATDNKVRAALQQYDATQGPTPSVARPLQILGVAQKMQSGGSSHGQPRYFALVQDEKPDKPPIMLEVKEELPAPLVGWTGANNAQAAASSAANWTGDIHRADANQVVQGQTDMGGAPNPLTGHTQIDGLSYLVREREPCKGSLSDKHLDSLQAFESVAQQAGKALALAHGRSPQQAQAILQWAGDPASFGARLNAFAQTYSDQAAADLKAFQAAHPGVSPPQSMPEDSG